MSHEGTSHYMDDLGNLGDTPILGNHYFHHFHPAFSTVQDVPSRITHVRFKLFHFAPQRGLASPNLALLAGILDSRFALSSAACFSQTFFPITKYRCKTLKPTATGLILLLALQHLPTKSSEVMTAASWQHMCLRCCFEKQRKVFPGNTKNYPISKIESSSA